MSYRLPLATTDDPGVSTVGSGLVTINGTLSTGGSSVEAIAPQVTTSVDGEPIPDSLPGLYRTSERCDNCGAYVPETKYCESWDAVVRPEYVCAVWVPIQGRW